MNQSTPNTFENELNLGDYVAILMVHIKTISAVIVTGTMLSVYITFVRTPVYKATTSVIVKDKPGTSMVMNFSGDDNKKRMANVHGDVKVVNKTGLAKLNKQFKKKGTLEADDFDDVKYKTLDISNHKPPVKKRW